MSQDIRLCFVGDSFVAGVGDETMLGWAGRLCADIDQTCLKITYYNLGVRRNTSRDVLARWEAECTPRFPDGKDARVIFSCGVNDSVWEDGAPRVDIDESCANMRRLLIDAKKKYRVLLVGPPAVEDQEQNLRISDLSAAFGYEAATLNVPYIEIFPVLVEDTAYLAEIAAGDGAHPGSAGYAKIAQVIKDSRLWWFHRTRGSD